MALAGADTIPGAGAEAMVGAVTTHIMDMGMVDIMVMGIMEMISTPDMADVMLSMTQEVLALTDVVQQETEVRLLVIAEQA